MFCISLISSANFQYIVNPARRGSFIDINHSRVCSNSERGIVYTRPRGLPSLCWYLPARSELGDAGVSKQVRLIALFQFCLSHPVKVLVLDKQNHLTEVLYSERLARSQGPAFMAFNDAIIKPRDWQALSHIHDSSKVADQS